MGSGLGIVEPPRRPAPNARNSCKAVLLALDLEIVSWDCSSAGWDPGLCLWFGTTHDLVAANSYRCRVSLALALLLSSARFHERNG